MPGHRSTPAEFVFPRRKHANTTKKGWRAGNINRPAFEPKEGGCRVRILTGAEFKKRKQELEARDREERARTI